VIAAANAGVRGLAIGLTLATVIAAGGCGGGSTGKTASGGWHDSRQMMPAYRVGQYCDASTAAKSRALGLECRHHHLAKR
jgi:hypothetical protein